jgi:dienelactone hydrolase
MRRRPFALLLVPALLAVTACSDDTSSGSTTTAPEETTTTLDEAAAAVAYREVGPYPVGVTTLALDEGPEVEVWYPAVPGTTGEVTYDARDFTPPAIQAILTGDASSEFTFAGARDADVADGTHPIVLFSHGFAGFRLNSSFLTSHLASWGMIVVAPDHPSRDLFNVLSGTADGDRAESVGDLIGSLDLILAEGTTAGGRFEGHVDPEWVAALGHSAGGGTILAAAEDDRLDGYVSMAAGGPEDSADFPDKPSFFLAGALDAIVPAAESSRPAFEAAPAPSHYWEIAEVGHNGFDDFCTYGNGTGIIGVAEASGLGALLDAQPQLRSLGEDGCIPPAAPIDQAFPIIRHGVTSWLQSLFARDEDPVGLEGAVATAYDLEITIDSK